MTFFRSTPFARLLAGVLAPALTLPVVADTAGGHHVVNNQEGQHAFDFLLGNWRVHHLRLKDRLVGSHEWIEFEGTSTVWQTLGGLGNVDDNWINLPEGAYRALSIRTYDPQSGQWAIWWLDGRSPLGDFDPPVKGSFIDDVGTFYAEDTFRGKPIRVRYTWSAITANSAHWEQAFSPDGGITWETNWRMRFTRVN